jgi:aspartate kinase
VLPGGFGVGADGAVRAYGPGGSDLTAAALGAGWGASEVRIWTADDGIQSADPSLVPGARPLPRLSYGEARALAAFGDRALHPDVLAVASETGLDLMLANLHRPARSTRISAQAPARPPGSVASVAYKEGLHLLRLPPEVSLEGLAGADAELRAAGAQRFGAIAGPEGVLLALRADGAAAVQGLAALADQGAELSAGWALVALVGEGLRATPGAALRLLAPFHRETVGGLLAGSSPISVSFLVPEERLGDLVPRLHHLWIEAAENPRVLAPLAL